jgi:hypothetical protein
MPYIPGSSRNILKDLTIHTDNVGDYNYLYTLAYLKVWLKEGNQRYKTIHALKKASLYPITLDEVNEVESRLTVTGVPIEDREVARLLAFAEFYRRVAGEYEDLAIYKNKDLPEYEQAQDLLFESYSKQG